MEEPEVEGRADSPLAVHPHGSAVTFRPPGPTGCPAAARRPRLLPLLAFLLSFLPLLDACGEQPNPARPPSVSSVSLSPDSARILVGDERRFQVEVLAPDGQALDRKVRWTSENPSVVTVDSSGDARAVGAGRTFVEARAGSASARAEVSVPSPDGTVSADGGDVASESGAVRLSFPPGALSAATSITVVPVDSTVLDTLTPPPRPASGTAYLFAPAGLDLAHPATLTVAYDPAALAPDTPGNLLRLHELVDGAWTLVAGSRGDAEGAAVTGSIDHFGIYALLAVPNRPPTARIEVPTEGASFSTADTVELRGSASDPEDGPLTGDRVVWRSDRDGRLGVGDSLRVAGLSEGEHTLILTATDANGAEDADSVNLTVSQAANRPPRIEIDAPADGTTFQLLDTVDFRAVATDPEDGPLPDSSIVWRSDLDGDLGTGTEVTATLNTTGTRSITVSGRDSDGAVAADTVSIKVPRTSGPPPSSPGSVSGRVERTQDGAGLDSVQVLLISTAADTARARTDAAGGYTYGGIMPGTYTVAVVTSTLPRFGSLAGPATRSVTVGSGQSVGVPPFDFTAPAIGAATMLSSDTSAVGDTVTVTLRIDASAVPEPIGGVGAHVDWDPSAVTYVDADPAASDLDLCAVNEDDTAAGHLSVSCASAAGTASDPLTVLSFRVAAGSAASVDFTPTVEELESIDATTGRITRLQTFVIFNPSSATWTIP